MTFLRPAIGGRRAQVTERMKLAAIFYRNEIFCDWCGVQIISTDVIRWDHFNPLGMGGEHDYTNLQPLHVKCHDEKTRGTGATTAGSDIGKIAKTKRIVRTSKFVVNKEVRTAGPLTPGVSLTEREGSCPIPPKPNRHWPSRKLPSRPFNRKKKEGT